MTQFYTYLWLRNDGTPYYAGKGHGDRAFYTNNRRFKSPPRERIRIQKWEDEQTALAMERYLINFYGRKDLGTGCLRNLTDGGEDPPKSAFKGKKHSEESRHKQSLAKIKTHCKRGHAFVDENLYVYKNIRYCAECKNVRQRLRRSNEEKSTYTGRDRTGRFVSVRIAP